MIAVMMEPNISPRARKARRARQAADRARAYRSRAKQALVIDGAIVDGLAAAFARVAFGMTIEAFIRDVAGQALRCLKDADVEDPSKIFGERVGLTSVRE